MNRTLTALLLAACAITTSSLAWAQDTTLDGCWYRWGARSYGSAANQGAAQTHPSCTVYFASNQATITCKTTRDVRVVEATLNSTGSRSLELVSPRITEGGRPLKVSIQPVALRYEMNQDKLFTVARGPDLQAERLQTDTAVVQSSHRKIPVGKQQCQQIGAATRSLQGIFNLPQPSSVSVNLVAAIRSKNLELAQTLLASGGDINCVNCEADLPLILAVFSQENFNMDLIGWLLERKADPNRESIEGVFGPYGGKTGFLRLGNDFARWIAGPEILYTGPRAVPWLNQFLQAGADVKAVTNDRSTFLHLYAGEAFGLPVNLQKAQYAIQAVQARGADINARDQTGYSPLMRGLVGGYNGQRRCPVEQVKLFLALGADTTVVALDGKTAFDIAVESAAAGDQRCNALLPLLKPQ